MEFEINDLSIDYLNSAIQNDASFFQIDDTTIGLSSKRSGNNYVELYCEYWYGFKEFISHVIRELQSEDTYNFKNKYRYVPAEDENFDWIEFGNTIADEVKEQFFG